MIAKPLRMVIVMLDFGNPSKLNLTSPQYFVCLRIICAVMIFLDYLHLGGIETSDNPSDVSQILVR